MAALEKFSTESPRNEFDRWAEAGRGEEMEEHHLPTVEPTLALMNLGARDNVLDIGCGSAGFLAPEAMGSFPLEASPC